MFYYESVIYSLNIFIERQYLFSELVKNCTEIFSRYW